MPDAIGRPQLAGFQNDLQQHFAATGGPAGSHQRHASCVISSQHRAIRKHDVHFVGAVRDRFRSLLSRGGDIARAGRKVRNHRNGNTRALQAFAGDGNETRPDAQRGDPAGGSGRIRGQSGHRGRIVGGVQAGEIDESQQASRQCGLAQSLGA